MTLYELLLIVPALLIVVAIGLFITSFFHYTPGEIATAIGRWFQANAMALVIYVALLVVLAIFIL